MRAFFHNMSMERWIILISMLAAVSLGSVGYFKFHRDRVDLDDAVEDPVKGYVPGLAKKIEGEALKYSKLYKEATLQGLNGESNSMESFIRALAAREQANLGQLAFDIKDGNSPRKGVKDVKYGITPQNRDRAFQRVGIANFLWLLESEGHRLRVSHLRMQLSPKNLKEYEVPPGTTDLWFWEAEVLSRQKSDK